MRVTVCELPYESAALDAAWKQLCAHTTRERSELVLLPELAFSEPVWLAERFDAATWTRTEMQHARYERRLGELGAAFVVGTRPVSDGGAHYNEGFLWSAESGIARLRRKHFLPDEPESFEARWFDRGEAEFPVYDAGDLGFGLNLCTELWALETYAGYRDAGAAAVLAPRATWASTLDKWLAIGTVAAVASGAYCLSSNRVHADGSCGGVGWAIDPDGALLARTSPDAPACTVDVDLARVAAAAQSYPRYVFRAER